jgi:putative sigma-54 modulation protein
MIIEVIGKNGFTPSVANREYAEKKLKKLNDFFGSDNELRALVVCKVYKQMHKVEITIPTKNLTMRAECSEQDLYAAIDRVVDKLLQQVRKYKTRVKSKLDKEGIKHQIPAELDVENLEHEMTAERIVKNKEIELEPMTLEEAISQMELLGHDFFVYLDKQTHKTNIIYLREDGNYANIETK